MKTIGGIFIRSWTFIADTNCCILFLKKLKLWKQKHEITEHLDPLSVYLWAMNTGAFDVFPIEMGDFLFWPLAIFCALECHNHPQGERV